MPGGFPSATQARTLDRYYILPRSSNEFAHGAPMDYSDQATAQEAIACAHDILKLVRTK